MTLIRQTLIASALMLSPFGATAKEKDLIHVASPRAGIVAIVNVKEGEAVKKGQVLLRLDDRIAVARLDIAKAKLEGSRADFEAANKSSEEARARFDRLEALAKKNAVNQEEVRAGKLAWERYQLEAASKAQAVKAAEGELKLAQTILEQHTILSPVDGVVKNVERMPGEGAKALEPVVVIRVGEK